MSALLLPPPGAVLLGAEGERERGSESEEARVEEAVEVEAENSLRDGECVGDKAAADSVEYGDAGAVFDDDDDSVRR